MTKQLNEEQNNNANVLCMCVPNTELKLKGGKNHKAFSRGLHSVFKDLIWVELHCKFGDLWFFNKVELMSISEVELV
jgi:hypothetical protein